MAQRILYLIVLFLASWSVMTFTHEMGHILGGWASGAKLQQADLIPWHLPYSFFDPDPYPLITLWGGLLLGVLAPLTLALLVRRNWMWFIAHFCLLANGVYILAGWIDGGEFLDTPKLLKHGASTLSIAFYCAVTIVFGYIGLRKSFILAWTGTRSEDEQSHQAKEQS